MSENRLRYAIEENKLSTEARALEPKHLGKDGRTVIVRQHVDDDTPPHRSVLKNGTGESGLHPEVAELWSVSRVGKRAFVRHA